MRTFKDKKSNVKNKTDELYEASKHKVESMAHQFTEGVSDLYEEGKHKIHQMEDELGEYSDELIKTIRNKPLAAVLIAGGIGFLISHLLKK